jgi:hypothetical protein
MMKKFWIFMGIVGVCLVVVGFAGMKLFASTAKIPFEGDACRALTAEDFAKVRGFQIVSTHKQQPTQCLYRLTGPDNMDLSVFFDTADIYSINRGIYKPVTALTGFGDEAYTGKAYGDQIVAVKAKGYYFRIDGGTGKFTLDELKQLAKAVLAKL